eukprot:COSAG05_NODE_1125_length_5794_cov_6.018450_5_plen_65_part_00
MHWCGGARRGGGGGGKAAVAAPGAGSRQSQPRRSQDAQLAAAQGAAQAVDDSRPVGVARNSCIF